jgi:hypothetical protein
LASVPISYSGKYATGRTLSTTNKVGILRTGWANTNITDAEPYGIVYRQLDNINGVTAVGSVFDTINTNVSMVNVPDARKIMSLTAAMLRANVVTLGFDWRHFRDITSVLSSIDDFFTKNGGAIDQIVPIDLYGFEAIPISNRVELLWNTVSECNINQFDVERANVNNGKIALFKKITTVDANRNNAIDNSYNITDRDVEYSNHYAYRIKVSDFDGNYNYSENRIVGIEDANFTVSEITPNPIRNSSTFEISNAVEQSIYVAIFDLAGREVFVLADDIFRTGIITFEINANKLNSGTYTIVIRAENNLITKEFTVVK